MTVVEAETLPLMTELRYEGITASYFLAKRGARTIRGDRFPPTASLQVVEDGFLWVYTARSLQDAAYYKKAYPGHTYVVDITYGQLRHFTAVDSWFDIDLGPDDGF